MTREERCQLAIDKGYTYNPETGLITGASGKIITGKFKQGYINLNIYFKNKVYSIKGHQFAWYFVNKKCSEQIDHINGIKDDNRICNLRLANNQINQLNKPSSKGYWFSKANNKYRAKISFNGKNIHLGYFENEHDAKQAYLEAKNKYLNMSISGFEAIFKKGK